MAPSSDIARSAPVQAVLFDYGMVLTGPPDPAAWARMAHITGLSLTELDRVYWLHRRDYDGGDFTAERYWHAAGEAASLKLTDGQISALIDADTDLWTQPNQPMIAWAARLQASGTKTGILSNLGDAMMRGVLERLSWLSGFDHLVWSHTLNLTKPNPAIYAHAAAGLQTSPDRILFVDDRADNIEGALTAGFQAIQYLDQKSFEHDLTVRYLGSLWQTGRASA